MKWIKLPIKTNNTPLDFIINVLIIIGSIFLILIAFFYWYLPAATNHGETITVPDLKGMHISKTDEYLVERNLTYTVNEDSGYTDKYPPKTILKQQPDAGTNVKEGRKIYLTLNAVNPPKVKMPNLVDGSVKNAQNVLQSYNLKIGEINYVPNIAANAVLEQYYKGDPIKEGTYIPKGSEIDLKVGDGMGDRTLNVPDLKGMPYDEAKVVVLGYQLNMGTVLYKNQKGNIQDAIPDSVKTSNNLIIFKQRPKKGSSARVGDEVDLWVETPHKADTTDALNEDF